MLYEILVNFVQHEIDSFLTGAGFRDFPNWGPDISKLTFPTPWAFPDSQVV